jgi:hypothetical protein
MAHAMHECGAHHLSMEVRMARERELIEPREGDSRYVRRDASGRFDEQVKVSRSLSQDQKKRAKSTAKKGQGNRGDRKK